MVSNRVLENMDSVQPCRIFMVKYEKKCNFTVERAPPATMEIQNVQRQFHHGR